MAEDIFNHKYAHEGAETWSALCRTLVEDVCGDHMSQGDKDQLTYYMDTMRFIAGGRYLYYAGRPNKFYNHCFLLKAEEDTREDWADLSWKSESCLMTGGGIGVDYSTDRKSTRLNSSHITISYAVFCLKKKKKKHARLKTQHLTQP